MITLGIYFLPLLTSYLKNLNKKGKKIHCLIMHQQCFKQYVVIEKNRLLRTVEIQTTYFFLFLRQGLLFSGWPQVHCIANYDLDFLIVLPSSSKSLDFSSEPQSKVCMGREIKQDFINTRKHSTKLTTFQSCWLLWLNKIFSRIKLEYSKKEAICLLELFKRNLYLS